MSVIVKGMEMPDGCENCLLRYRSQVAYCTDRCYATVAHKNIDPWTFGRTRNGDKPDWCPLHPLPEKHGRLIDADALYDALGVSDEDICFKHMLEECQTIVEAEGDDA